MLKSYQESELIHLLEKETLEQARSSILAYTAYTKPDYEINWHHRSAAHYLDRFVSREITRLMLFLPPRTGKSELASRRLPSYILGLSPDERIISASYGAEFANRLNRDVQRIISSEPYERLFPLTKLAENAPISDGHFSQTQNYFEVVNHRGTYRSVGVGGSVTGMGGDTILVDDPVKNQAEADSLTFRDRIWDWWTSVIYTRLEKNARILVTLTRWHEDDLAGRLLKLAKEDPTADQWNVVSYPMIKE